MGGASAPMAIPDGAKTSVQLALLVAPLLVLLSFFVDTASGGWWFTLFTAVLGAVILLFLLGLIKRRA